jgi:hypothetical protein
MPVIALRGTRIQQLVQLDATLFRLYAMRRDQLLDERNDSRDRRTDLSARDFWLAGVVFAVMLGLLTLGAWAIGADIQPRATSVPTTLHASR